MPSGSLRYSSGVPSGAPPKVVAAHPDANIDRAAVEPSGLGSDRLQAVLVKLPHERVNVKSFDHQTEVVRCEAPRSARRRSTR